MHALVGVSAAIWPGETLGLVGESGSGKTTLARALLGLVQPTTGAVVLDGKELAGTLGKRDGDDLRALQIVFQNPDSALNRRHQVRRILLRSLKKLAGKTGKDAETRMHELMSSVRLAERYVSARPSQLSGGLKQRLAIARAFAGDPLLVVCDEPTSALDVSVQAAILNLLVELQAKERVSYMFISHDLGVVRYVSDRIAVLYLGRLMELGTLRGRLRRPPSPLHRGAPLRGADDRRARARADQARGRDPERREPADRLRLPYALPASGRGHLRRGRAPARRGRGEPPHALPHPDRRAPDDAGRGPRTGERQRLDLLREGAVR